ARPDRDLVPAAAAARAAARPDDRDRRPPAAVGRVVGRVGGAGGAAHHRAARPDPGGDPAVPGAGEGPDRAARPADRADPRSAAGVGLGGGRDPAGRRRLRPGAAGRPGRGPGPGPGAAEPTDRPGAEPALPRRAPGL